ncbi:uncharacterized protein K444DRAFT_623368 [Hyaloscypha bicolor E]|uniref:Uncharacterized protein n=1 Tax=Hyaloscypha bicolor E TaxID=1095630 RepID=A0A2J6TW29_9HELO|nr:uncharacterized protein K444DRAFT_623368 [Hyaloscypha bicolor E]PMD67158.1 hypothetical protein K444DRAFT_623368 [Hyaloscypha bicolor E]
MSAPPSLRYQASIYSTHSHSHPYRYGYRSNRNTSLEQLVPKKRVRFDGKAPPADRTHKSKPRMSASEDGGITIERKKSYGIGGAGNIRRPSDVIYPVRLNADGTRRRSSVFSTSPDGKRAGIMSFFRRSSSQSEASNGAPERDPDENANGRG